MPAFTYLSESEYTQPTGNPAVDDAFAELRRISGEDWRIGLLVATTGRLWWKRQVEWFSLYAGVGHGEFQVINFYREGGATSINHHVPADLVVAYMLGVLNGLATADRRAIRAPAE